MRNEEDGKKNMKCDGGHPLGLGDLLWSDWGHSPERVVGQMFYCRRCLKYCYERFETLD